MTRTRTLQLILPFLMLGIAGAGCVTERVQPTCKEVLPQNCVGTNVRQVCETVDGCRRCACAASSPDQPLRRGNATPAVIE